VALAQSFFYDRRDRSQQDGWSLMSRIGGFVAVAVISALITWFVAQSMGDKDAARCDIHPHLSSTGLSAMRANMDRARRVAHDAAIADKQDGDAANRAGEDAAFDSFVYNLRGALGVEYQRHRQALDGCF
jgi:hypothetical protein